MSKALSILLATAVPILVVCSMIGCQGSNEPLPAKKQSRFQVAQDEPSPIADAVESSAPSSNANLPAKIPAEVAELTRFLAQLRAEEQRVRDKEQLFKILLNKEQAASKLLEMKIDDSQRFQAVGVKLDALIKLMKLGDIEAGTKLQKFAGGLVDDPQEKVALSANIALLVSNSFILLRQKDSDLQPVLEQANKIIQQFPDSFEALQEIYPLSDSMMRMQRRDEALQLMTMLKDSYPDAKDARIKGLTGAIASRLKIAETNFDVIMNDVRAAKPGAVDQYGSAIKSLVTNPDFDASMYNEISNSLIWLEDQGLYEAALKGNGILNQSASSIGDEELRKLITRRCQLRVVRLGLIGKPIRFEAKTVRGEDLDWTKYEGRAILVLFWATSDRPSIQLMQQLGNLARAKQGEGLEFLAINIASDLSPMNSLFGGQFPIWDVAVSDQPGSGNAAFNDLAEKFGIARLPTILLVDKGGQIVAINPKAADLQAQIDSLLN